MRNFLVYPTYAVYPQLVPQVQLFDALHRGREAIMQKKRLRFFWIIFVAVFVWEWFPVCILHFDMQRNLVSDHIKGIHCSVSCITIGLPCIPNRQYYVSCRTLTGISIFCLANQNSAWFTRIFGIYPPKDSPVAFKLIFRRFLTGGAAGNEGLGVFSLCLDWAYIGSAGSSIGSLFTPLSTLLSLYAGSAVCM